MTTEPMKDDLTWLTEQPARLHIYRLPEELNSGFCFGGGNSIAFLNVDFFDVPWNIPREEIKTFIQKKAYFDPAARFLILATAEYPTLTFTIEPTEHPHAL